jgi:N-acetylglucosaminyl-diphospho-decaprenol L-rhamnosyltransferase
MPPAKLSICIVNYNSGKVLENCLDSLSHYPPSCSYEVIVVDNASIDGSQLCVTEYNNVRLIQNRANVGFAVANNQALDTSHGEYFLMLNADTEVQAKALNELIRFADTHPRAGIISGKLFNPDGSPQIGFNVRRLPNLSMAFAQLVMLDEIFPRNPITRSAGCWELDYNQPQMVEQPAASALLLRRVTWEEVGGFDTVFRNWYNDCDLCKRVRDSGWEIWFCPFARIMHHGGMGSASRPVVDVTIEVYRSMRLYYLKHYGLFRYQVTSLMIVLGMVLRVLILQIDPRLEQNIHTYSSKEHMMAQNLVFWAVLKDTLKSFLSLPRNVRFSNASYWLE